MWAFVQKLFIGHSHTWEIHSEHNIVDYSGGKIGLSYHCRCTICGKMKSFSLEP
jgi:hypothetical protein